MADKDKTRRQFIVGGALAAVGGTAAWLTRHWRQQQAPEPRQDKVPLGPDFFYNVDQYRDVDPGLIRYEVAARFSVDMRVVRSITCGPDGSIWVAGEKKVQHLSRQGAHLGEFAVGGLPRGLCVHNGRILVGARDHVEIYHQGGDLITSFERLKKAVITSIDADDARIYVADAGNRLVWRFSHDGELIDQLTGFVVPSPFFPLAVAPDGLLRVVNPGEHRIDIYTADGERELSWGKSGFAIDGFCGCCNPVGLAMMPDGRYVTAEKGLPRVKIYSARGDFDCVVAPPALFPDNEAACRVVDQDQVAYSCSLGGLDVALDHDGRIQILDLVKREILTMTERDG